MLKIVTITYYDWHVSTDAEKGQFTLEMLSLPLSRWSDSSSVGTS